MGRRVCENRSIRMVGNWMVNVDKYTSSSHGSYGSGLRNTRELGSISSSPDEKSGSIEVARHLKITER